MNKERDRGRRLNDGVGVEVVAARRPAAKGITAMWLEELLVGVGGRIERVAVQGRVPGGERREVGERRVEAAGVVLLQEQIEVGFEVQRIVLMHGLRHLSCGRAETSGDGW